MKETVFVLEGQFVRPNGHTMHAELLCMSATAEEAVDTCQRNNPHFQVHTVTVDDSKPEVVRMQSLR